MYGVLLKHQWLKLLRSRYFSQGWGVKLLMGFLIIYFSGIFLLLGFALPEILSEAYSSAEKLTPVFLGFVLYYLIIDLIMRFFLQDLNIISVQHYLTLPVKNSRVVHYLLQTSALSIFNLLPLFVIIPFFLRVISQEYSGGVTTALFITLISLILINHYTAIYLKRKWVVKYSVLLFLIVTIGGVLAADYYEYISLFETSKNVMMYLPADPWLVSIPLLLLGAVYILNYYFLKGQTYLDVWQKSPSSEKSMREFDFLESKGISGALLANEIKLILRNKRTRTVLFLMVFGILYGLIFYTQPEYNDGWVIFIFTGIFITGIFMMNYGQFLLAWESAYFDGILTRSYSIIDFYKSKYLLLIASCAITYVLSSFYVIFGWKAFFINTACFFYNIGFNTFLILYASTYQKKRIDLSRGSAFNYQGTSVLQFIIVIPLMILPILIFQSFNVFDKPYWGLIALGATGLLSLAFYRKWLQAISNNFYLKKYRNAQGFREVNS